MGSTGCAPNDDTKEKQSQGKTTINRKHLLATSGATPIGSTAVPPMTKTTQANRKQTHQPSYAVEKADFIFDGKIKTAQVRMTWSSRFDIRSNNTRRHWRSSSRNHTRNQDSRSHRRYGLTNSSRRILSVLGSYSRVNRLQVD